MPSPTLVQAVLDPALPRRDLRVFVLLLDELSHDYKPLKHSWLAKRLDIARQHAQESLTRLTEHGYLESGPDDGSLRTYRLTAA